MINRTKTDKIQQKLLELELERNLFASLGYQQDLLNVFFSLEIKDLKSKLRTQNGNN